jgi:hypothetical protein
MELTEKIDALKAEDENLLEEWSKLSQCQGEI